MTAATALPIQAFAARALGSELRLQVHRAGEVGDEPGAADAAWNDVLAEFAAVDVALSRFRDDSELTALNRRAGSGEVVPVSWRLRTMLAAVHRATRITGGRFDATVLDALERLGERGAALPVAGPPGDTRGGSLAPTRDPARDIGARLDRPCRVVAPARPIDSGGIGKGLALRWAAAAAVGRLPAGAGVLLDAGGDVVAAGTPPAAGWRVGIEDPVAPDGAAPIAVVRLDAGALATSSVRVRHWVSPGGEHVHHLVDPRTGDPARTGLLAVTVAGPDPAWAEVWTKALFLAGRSGIGPEARARGLAAWWVAADGGVGLTPAARERSAWVAESRLG